MPIILHVFSGPSPTGSGIAGRMLDCLYDRLDEQKAKALMTCLPASLELSGPENPLPSGDVSLPRRSRRSAIDTRLPEELFLMTSGSSRQIAAMAENFVETPCRA